MRKGIFIAFEGIDGSGKSTQVARLAERLREAGNRAVTTAEPTQGPIGRMIREIFAHRQEADHRSIAALFAADRIEHIINQHDGLLKLLEEHQCVITDRYYFSSYAYHSAHMNMQWVIQLNAECAHLLRPDLTIYVDISPEESMKRLKAGRNATELYETIDNLSIVRKKYFEAFELLKEEEKVLIVDGNRSASIVSEDIWKAVSHLLHTQTTMH